MYQTLYIVAHLALTLSTEQLIKIIMVPWLSRLGIVPQSEGLPVSLPVEAHAWTAGPIPGWGVYKRQLIEMFLPHISVFSLFLPPSPTSKNK